MANEARITFEGRMGSDFELRFLPSGQAVGNVNIAVDQRKKVDDKWETVGTSWFRVGVFGTQAENLTESTKKGDLVHVSGTLVLREYEKDGVKRISADVTADFVAPSLRFRVLPHSDGPKDARAATDPWTTPEGGGSFTDEPPF
jgi:single-strand DNA-binding protein